MIGFQQRLKEDIEQMNHQLDSNYVETQIVPDDKSLDSYQKSLINRKVSGWSEA